MSQNQMSIQRKNIQDYFFGSPQFIGEKILFIRRASRLDEYKDYLQDIQKFGHVWHGISGILRGEKVSIIAAGIGASQVGDAIYALDKPGSLCLYSGTCGGLGNDVQIGDYFLAQQAVSGDGYGLSFEYEPFSIVKSHQPTFDRLKKSFEQLDIRHSWGTVFSTSSVVRECEPVFWDFVNPICQAIEMECAAFYVGAYHSRKYAASFFWVTDLPKRDKSFFDLLSTEEVAVKQERYEKMVSINLSILSSL
jgi:purine-nucleoside phosphorylase